MASPSPQSRFRADQIGSLLRPQYLLDAQDAVFPFASMHNHYKPEADQALIDKAHELEKQAIADVVRQQVERGVTPITSGEFARASFVSGFFEKLEGIEIQFTNFEESFKTDFPIIRPYMKFNIPGRDLPIAVGKVRWRESAYMDEWMQVRNLLPEERWKDVKMTIPAPCWTHLQVKEGKAWKERVYDGERADEEYLRDCGEAVRQEILALYEAGCRFVQIDDPMIAMCCDSTYLATQAKEGHSLASLLAPAITAHNAATHDLPPDLTLAIHLCRGNQPKGDLAAVGGFDDMMPTLFRELNYKRFALEFDNPEITGGFEVLRHLPRGNVVVLGLVTTKDSVVESVGELKERVMQAADCVAEGQGRGKGEVLGDSLAVSPSCGFASLNFLHGVDVEETQWQKLEVVRKLAQEVFGGV